MQNILNQLSEKMNMLSSRIHDARTGDIFVIKPSVQESGICAYKNYNDYRKLSLSIIDMFGTYVRVSNWKTDEVYSYYNDFLKGEIDNLSKLLDNPQISTLQYSCLSSIYSTFIEELIKCERFNNNVKEE